MYGRFGELSGESSVVELSGHDAAKALHDLLQRDPDNVDERASIIAGIKYAEIPLFNVKMNQLMEETNPEFDAYSVHSQTAIKLLDGNYEEKKLEEAKVIRETLGRHNPAMKIGTSVVPASLSPLKADKPKTP